MGISDICSGLIYCYRVVNGVYFSLGSKIGFQTNFTAKYDVLNRVCVNIVPWFAINIVC